MILSQIKNYLIQQQVVSLFELTKRFNADPQIMRDMLQLFIQKGKLQARKKTNSCGGKCTKCDPIVIELYEWIEGKDP